ncbi:MAG: type 4a pilus biogenesis protein PilO [Leptothrix sp. (in: b-proteobacteria)]
MANLSVDLESMFGHAATQFRDLNPNEPGQWPTLPKVAVWLAAAVLVVLLAWLTVLSDALANLDAEAAKEQTLKESYRGRLAQAVNLDELRKQKLQVQEYVTQLERQLPGKAEMDALLSDINQSGLGRGLQFELFRPGQIVFKDYYAELPIAIKVTGRYHDIGAFAADIANLSRIVTLHNFTIATPAANSPQANSGQLVMEATARTYRYLEKSEAEAAQSKGPGTAKRVGDKP